MSSSHIYCVICVKIGPRDLNPMLLLFYEFHENRRSQCRAFLVVVNGSTFCVYCESYAILSAKTRLWSQLCQGVRHLQSYRICVSRFMYLVLDVNVEHSVLFFYAWIIIWQPAVQQHPLQPVCKISCCCLNLSAHSLIAQSKFWSLYRPCCRDTLSSPYRQICVRLEARCSSRSLFSRFSE